MYNKPQVFSFVAACLLSDLNGRTLSDCVWVIFQKYTLSITKVTLYHNFTLSPVRPPHPGSQPARAHHHTDLFPHLVPWPNRTHPDTKLLLSGALSDQSEESECWGGGDNSIQSFRQPWQHDDLQQQHTAKVMGLIWERKQELCLPIIHHVQLSPTNYKDETSFT